jgi:hypothetical protein
LATPATAGAPGLAAAKLLRSLPPRQCERIRARSSRTLRSPDNSRHRGHPGIAARTSCCHSTTPAIAGAPGLTANNGCVPFLSANASASGLTNRAPCVHLTTPAIAGAPGLTATRPLPSLPPRHASASGHAAGTCCIRLTTSRQRGRLRAPSTAELHPRFTPCSTEPFNSRADVPSGTKSAERFGFNTRAPQAHANLTRTHNRSHARRAHGCVRSGLRSDARRVQT